MIVSKRHIFFVVFFIVPLSTLYLMKRSEMHLAVLRQQAKEHHQDFDTSMQKTLFPESIANRNSAYTYEFCKALYEKNNLSSIMPQQEPLIPKIIHIMWLGGKLPEEYIPYVASWRSFHPDWTILFWTDSEANYNQGNHVVHNFEELTHVLKEGIQKNIVIEVTGLHFENRIFYDQALNYGERSDILKWEIVYRFGGLYVDTDYECYKAHDLFHHCYHFYTGIQPLDTNWAQLGAALFAAIPGHPILEQCVKTIKNNQHITQIINKTGPIHFTRCFLITAGKDSSLKDIAFPASYFYPCGYEQKGTDKQTWCKNESYAVHHWAGSWLKPEAFVRSTKSLELASNSSSGGIHNN